MSTRRTQCWGMGPLLGVMLVAASCQRVGAGVRLVGDSSARFVPHLSGCTESIDQTIEIDPEQPLAIIVHGCDSSGGRFQTLAGVFRLHGQQAVCFEYNDRDGLDETATRMTEVLRTLAESMNGVGITVLGHSQGGLVARRALVAVKQRGVGCLKLPISLVTVSSPFAGIDAAAHCGLLALHIATLGVTAGICQLITGSKWTEIFPGAEFMEQPGALASNVTHHLRIATDERNTCRRRDPSGQCVEDDFVFSMAEQEQPAVDSDPRVSDVAVKAGHVEIVGDVGVVPKKLLDVLRAQGFLTDPAPGQAAEVAWRVEQLYAAP